MIDQLRTSSCPHGELATGWALHTLEPAEESMVAAHLADCEECTRTAADTEHVGATLGLSLPELTPSPALEQRILAITSTVQNSPAMPAPTSLRLTQRRRALCVPDVITVLSVMLIVMALAAMIVFYLI
ncbi:MAG: hypothetical protein ACRDRV_01525 [Pseudonocardiaceae bacterium]